MPIIDISNQDMALQGAQTTEVGLRPSRHRLDPIAERRVVTMLPRSVKSLQRIVMRAADSRVVDSSDSRPGPAVTESILPVPSVKQSRTH